MPEDPLGASTNGPIVKEFPDGSLRQYDPSLPAANPWRVLQWATPKDSGASGGADTLNVGGVIMQWNPETGRYDIPVGSSRAPSAPAQPPTPQTYTAINGDLVGIDPRTGAEVYRIPGVDYARMSPQEQERIRQGDIAAANAFTTRRDATQNAFTAGQNEADRTFTAGENALDRALRAGDLAASIQIQNEQNRFKADQAYQQARERYTAQQLSGAQQVADNISNVDPGALPAFYAAGGGLIANALARGATAQSDMANLGSARALSAVENAAPPERFSYTPATFDPQSWIGFGQPPAAAPAPTVTPPPVVQQPQTWDVGVASPLGPASSGTPEAIASGYAGMQANAAKGVATAFDAQGRNWAMENGKWVERFATGTMGDIPAPQQFISGDAMAADPAAGGARPELVTVDDPEGNARLSVDPLVPGGGGGQSQMGPLFRAIADFLDGGQPVAPPAPTGGMPRFATGTDPFNVNSAVQDSDRPYLDRVREIRDNVEYGEDYLNPFDVAFERNAPSQTSRFFAGRQTRWGIPIADQVAEFNQFRLPGTSRGAMNLGV